MTGRLEWMDSALCAQTDPELFFVPQGVNPHKAKALCASCEVQQECEAWTRAGPHVREGVWAGKTERVYRGTQTRQSSDSRKPDPRIEYMISRGWTLAEIGRELNMSEGQVWLRSPKGREEVA